MSEFVGRTGSMRVYSYPEPRRTGSEPISFARNFATVKNSTPLGSQETTLDWVADVPADPVDTEQVPITPIVTGVVEISGVVVIFNDEATPQTISVAVDVDGSGAGSVEFILPADTRSVIPFLVQVEGLTLEDTVPVTVIVSVSNSDLDIALEEGWMAVQEVPVSTG